MPGLLGAPVFPKQRAFSLGFWLLQVLEALLGILITGDFLSSRAGLPCRTLLCLGQAGEPGQG